MDKRLVRATVVLLATMLSACVTGGQQQGVTTLGSAAPRNAFSCALQSAASRGYVQVGDSDGSVAVLAKQRAGSLGKEVITRVLSMGTAGAAEPEEDRFIVSSPDRYLRIDVVAVEPSGNDASPSDESRSEAGAILRSCAGSQS